MYIIIGKCIHSGVLDLDHFQSPMKYFLHTEILSSWSVYYTTTKMFWVFFHIYISYILIIWRFLVIWQRISVDEYVFVFHAECRSMKYLSFDELALPQYKDCWKMNNMAYPSGPRIFRPNIYQYFHTN